MLKTQSKRTKAVAAMIFTVFFWGMSFISIKITVTALPPMTQAAFRYIFALAFLSALKIINNRRNKSRPTERLKLSDVPLLAGSGITGISLYFFFENNGVRRIDAGEASIIVSMVPVLSMLAERLVFKTKIFRRQWTGAFISIAGVVLISKTSFGITGKPAGYFFMAAASSLWVLYCFLTEPLFKRASRFYIVFWQSVFGFAGLLLFAVFEHTTLQNISLTVILNLLFLGIFCSALGYLLYIYALKILGVPVTSMFINAIPVVSCAGAFFLLGERLLPMQLAGGALIISGVYLATRKS